MILRGRVKWFDNRKGYGFVTIDDPAAGSHQGMDAFLPRENIKRGQFMIKECGVRVRLTTRKDGRLLVTEILEVFDTEKPTCDIGILKEYSRSVNYGFFTIPRIKREAFIHKNTLTASGIGDSDIPEKGSRWLVYYNVIQGNLVVTSVERLEGRDEKRR